MTIPTTTTTASLDVDDDMPLNPGCIARRYNPERHCATNPYCIDAFGRATEHRHYLCQ